MARLFKYKKTLICGVVISATALAASAKYNFFDNFEQENEIPKFPPKFATFSSALPLGKVLASWTTNFEPSVKWDSNWDRQAPEELVNPKDLKKDADQAIIKKPTASRNLILIRHGQYEDQEKLDENRILTTLGQEQAVYTGMRLKELNHPYTIIVNSTMTRAIETCDIICKSLPIEPRQSNDLLREGRPIPPEPPLRNWSPNATFFKDGARIEAAFRNYFYRASPKQTEDSYEVIVCHANVIRYFVCRALQLPPEAWLRMSLAHGSVTQISIRPSGNVVVKSLGDVGHMPADKISYH